MRSILPSGFSCKQLFRELVRLAIFTILAVALACNVAPAATVDADTWIDANVKTLVELYQELHQAPELSQQEKETGEQFAAELRKAGFQVTTNVGGYGVVGVLKNGPGKTLLLRTDLDALPVAEETGLPYASKVRTKDERGATVGVMHACGHDLHMTNMVGVAQFLASHRSNWSGTLVVIGQPAEEKGQGAQAMLDDGLLRRFPRPDFAVALHVGSDLRRARSSTVPATRRPTSTASTSRSRAAADTVLRPIRRSTRL